MLWKSKNTTLENLLNFLLGEQRLENCYNKQVISYYFKPFIYSLGAIILQNDKKYGNLNGDLHSAYFKNYFYFCFIGRHLS